MLPSQFVIEVDTNFGQSVRALRRIQSAAEERETACVSSVFGALENGQEIET